MKPARPILPLFRKRPQSLIEPISSTILYNSHSFGQKNFAQLSSRQAFEELRASCIEVDLTDECRDMTEESFLEVTVPVLTLNDLKGTIDSLNQTILHPMLIAVNGYGAKTQGENNFPYVDFIYVLDLADNRYEIVVSPDGTLEFPKNGLGLFTIIKDITYVLSYRPVIKGEGLEDLISAGACRNTLYIQPPPGTQESFIFHVCLTHLNEKNCRIVDSIRPVEINFHLSTIEPDLAVLSPRLLYVKFDVDATTHSVKKEFEGWKQHPICSNVWLKRFGLQLSTRMALIKLLYNEHEFMRDFLAKKGLVFSTHDDYNNFLLWPQTFSRIYEKLVHDVAHGYLSKEFLFELIDEKAHEKIDFTVLSADFHDKSVLLQLKKESATSHEFLSRVFSIPSENIESDLPKAAMHVAMLPVAETQPHGIPDLPTDWVNLSNCPPSPKLI